MDDLSGGFRDYVPDGVKFVEGSVTDAALVKKLFAENNFDYVFHLAAYAAEGLSHFIKHFNYTNNLLGSVNLINASVNHGVKCFVFTSSIAVYGKNQLPMTEDAVPQPEDPYGIAKYAVELDLKEAHEMFGLNHVDFPAAQCLWRISKYRRPLPQRHRHFYESNHARPADDDFRRRQTNARIQLH